MLKGAAGNTLVADVFGDTGQPVMLLHGGGQTRHAWGRTARASRARRRARLRDRPARPRRLANGSRTGITASRISPTTRRRSRARSRERTGQRPIAIGASLGGMSSLLAEGKAERAGQGPLFAAIVLVDITPRVDRSGVDKIQGFMRERVGGRFRHRRGSRRRGRGLSAASQAPALA